MKRNERPVIAPFNLPPIKETPITEDEAIQKLITDGRLSAETKKYSMGSLLILVSPPSKMMNWHMQIIGTTRYPTIEEILRIRFSLLPRELNFIMTLPDTQDYFDGKLTFMFYQRKT